MRVLLAIALGLLTGQATASTFERIGLPTLVQHATQGVVQGRVLSVSTAWDDDQQVIFTSAVFEISRPLSGAFGPGEQIVVREAGGEVDGFTIEAIGFPQLEVGKELVLFLGPTWEDGDLRVADYGAGFYEVIRKNGREVLVQGPLQQSPPIEAPVDPGTTVTELTAALRALGR